MFDIAKWMIGITRLVLAPLLLFVLCRIIDQLLGICLYIVLFWSVERSFLFFI